MFDVPKDALTVIYQLLPGFLAAWIFYAFTAHSKAGPFERIVEALILTAIIKVLVIALSQLFFLLGHAVSLGFWTEDSALVVSLVIAVALGLLLARYAHTNKLHEKLCYWGFSCRTSYPSEWFSAFRRQRTWVVLHLKDQRRLYGWPQEWPDHPDVGHFIIDQPEWLLEDGRSAPVHQVRNILVPATEVQMVEFMLNIKDIQTSQAEVDRVKDLLVLLHKKEGCNGSKSATTSP
jgi:hypothetical protein